MRRYTRPLRLGRWCTISGRDEMLCWVMRENLQEGEDELGLDGPSRFPHFWTTASLPCLMPARPGVSRRVGRDWVLFRGDVESREMSHRSK